MNKTDLVADIAKKSGLTKVQSRNALEAAIGSITRSLSKGETVQLIGFGSFAVAKRSARVGHNPRTGVEIKIAAKKVPVFRPGQNMKSAVSKK
jgi:nucleoid DNA-binding protein